MKVNIQVQCTTKSLDQRYRARAGCLFRITCLLDQMHGDDTVNDTQHLIFAGGLWGIIFLIPIYNRSPIKKGVTLSVLPWLSSAFIVFPFRMEMGWFGLGFGLGTPIWTLFFAAIWGVTGTLFLSKFSIVIKN